MIHSKVFLLQKKNPNNFNSLKNRDEFSMKASLYPPKTRTQINKTSHMMDRGFISMQLILYEQETKWGKKIYSRTTKTLSKTN